MIGVFDSGLGGLTALLPLRELAPDADVVYFGDTGRVPYGTRSRETIIRFSAQDMRFLSSLGELDAVLIACGTISSTAIDVLRERTAIPLVGVVEGAAGAAVAATKNGRVGVLGTGATIASGAFSRTIAAIEPDIEVCAVPCPLFVPLVENGFIGEDDEITALVARRYLAPLASAGVDTVILGCTHFPIIAHAIAAALPEGVTLINSGAEAAKAVARYARHESGGVVYYVSDSPGSFGEVARIFTGGELGGDVRLVDIDSY